jgi:hypothetical protein
LETATQKIARAIRQINIADGARGCDCESHQAPRARSRLCVYKWGLDKHRAISPQPVLDNISECVRFICPAARLLLRKRYSHCNREYMRSRPNKARVALLNGANSQRTATINQISTTLIAYVGQEILSSQVTSPAAGICS